MSASLLERLRAALAPDYEVERELGTGGQGTIFLARDVTLERAVAIKILRPEMATAVAKERFQREARILASFSHPNIVPIHNAGEKRGLSYYVMDYVQGETLDKRIERGPLHQDEVVQVGADLLSALEAAHAAGVIHRDVKPSNIFLVEGRALLGDFGIAKPVEDGREKLTPPGGEPGTPDYMPPEHVAGESMIRTDLYGVGMVLFEAATGRRWPVRKQTDDADWSGVHRRLARVLKKALAWSPNDRWEDAAAFREALSLSLKGVPPGAGLIAGALAIALVAAGYFAIKTVTSPSLVVERDLALLPVEIQGEWSEPLDGADLARLVYNQLESAPEMRLVPTLESFAWWDSATSAAGSTPVDSAADGLRAKYAARVRLIAEDDSLSLILDVYRRSRRLPGQQPTRLGRVGLIELSDSISLRILRALPGKELSVVARLTSDADAAIEFLYGEKAFERGAWAPAVEYYEAAIAIDSSFALAWWHMANAYRWLGHKGPYRNDYQHVFEEHAVELGSVDSLLMAAQLTPAGPERFSEYEEAYALDQLNYFGAYLLGEELFNRGALWGRPLEEAVGVLKDVVNLNPLWASAHVHLIWANIRLGQEDAARSALQQLPEVAADPDEGWRYPPELLWQALYERFEPESAVRGRQELFLDPLFGSPEWIAILARLGGAFDLPTVQVNFGTLLIEDAAERFSAAGCIVRGLGNAALGRRAAIADFDSAATLLDKPEARLLAAEWRVIPRALGIPLGTGDQQAAGRERLAGFVDDDSLGARAAWALAMDAFAAGDLAGARSWADRAAGQPPLATFLQAMEEATQERFTEALKTSDTLLAMQTVAMPLQGTPKLGTLDDPFARAALHLKRGEWLAARGDSLAAEREWLWYEAVDIDGLPSVELPQPGEVDWALGNYGRYLRGKVALQDGDLEAACRHLGRIAELWSGSDPAFDGYLREARDGAERACGPRSVSNER